MKKFSDAITVAAFFAILIMFAVSTVFFQDDLPFERLFSKDVNVGQAVSEYVSDSFPMRKNWRSIYTNIMVFSGRRRFGDSFLAGDRLVKLDKKNGSSKVIENVAHINELAANTESPIYMMLAPTAAGVYSADIPEFFADKTQRERINDAYLQLDRRIASIDAFYPLYSARDEYVYYRTENLWTSFGAYYAYSESTKKLGLQAVTLDNYDQEFAEAGFYGSMYDSAMVSGIVPDRINIFRSKYQSPVTEVDMFDGSSAKQAESVYFRSALKSSKKTDIFLQGDKHLKTDIYTDLDNDSELLLIKGSFANTIVPFYTAHYSRITMVDPKKLKEADLTLSDVADINEYDQILVMYDIESFSYADYLDTLK